MLKTLSLLVSRFAAPGLELAGASAVVYGTSMLSAAAAWIVAGAALLLKAVEADLTGDAG